MYMFMGLLAQMVNAMVPSSSPVKGSGTLQSFINWPNNVVSSALMTRKNDLKFGLITVELDERKVRTTNHSMIKFNI